MYLFIFNHIWIIFSSSTIGSNLLSRCMIFKTDYPHWNKFLNTEFNDEGNEKNIDAYYLCKIYFDSKKSI